MQIGKPLLSLSSIGQSATHQLAADIAREGLPPGEKVTHKTTVNGTKIKVTLSPASPKKPKIKPPPECPPDATPNPPIEIRDVEECVLEAAPAPGKRAISVKKLAALAGYGYSSYFREKVRKMIDAGLLVRVTGGVRLAG